MRGGAIPLLAWGALLTLLLAVNWVWTNDTIQVTSFGFAAGVILLGGVLLIAASHGDAVRRGAPPPSAEPEAVPTASVGAVATGIAVAAIVFGLAFGRFLVLFGAGLLIASVGRVALEVRAERRALRAVARRSTR